MEKVYAPFNTFEQEPVKALEQLFSQAHVLKPEDHDSLGSIVFRLSSFSRMDNPGTEDTETLLPFLDEAIRQFGGEIHLTSDEG